MQLGECLAPNLSTLTTFFSQDQKLQTLREHSVIAFETLSDESIRIKKIVATFSNNRSSAHSILVDSQVRAHTVVDATPNDRLLINNRYSAHVDTQVHYNNSQAEPMIVDTTTKDRPLTK